MSIISIKKKMFKQSKLDHPFMAMKKYSLL